MKRLLMSCDEYVYKHNGRYYAGNAERMDFFERYLRVFDRLRLVLRCEEEEVLNESRIPLDKDSRIEFVPVPMFRGPKEYARKYFAVGKSLRGITEGCDAAVLRLPSTVAMRIGSQVVGRLPYACEVVLDVEAAWKGTSGISRLAWRLIDRRVRDLCRKADGVSCVTERYLQQRYYPAGSDAFTSHYSSLSLPSSFYGGAKTCPRERPLVIAHTANQVEFNGIKGQNEVIEALGILKKRGVDAVVRFAGKGENGGVEKLRAYAAMHGVENNVEFAGFLSREQLDRFLSEAHLYVMPSRFEGLPRSIIEAMAKGLPCVTTPVSGNPELVDQHFLVDYHDVETLADRIEELARDASLYERTSKRNFERSWKYEASILEKRRDEFYSKLKQRTEKD